jgi:hypothetical protein
MGRTEEGREKKEERKKKYFAGAAAGFLGEEMRPTAIELL